MDGAGRGTRNRGDILELPKRKNMRLKNYDYSQNNAYFITICTQNKQHLFGEIVGATLCGRPNNPDKVMGKWLIETQNKFENVKIDKFIIMPNHVHIIMLLTGDHTGSPLPQIVDWYKTMTTNEYIRGVKNGLFVPFDKRLWQRSFHDHIIRGETEYLKIWQYIDENPIEWTEDK